MLIRSDFLYQKQRAVRFDTQSDFRRAVPARAAELGIGRGDLARMRVPYLEPFFPA